MAYVLDFVVIAVILQIGNFSPISVLHQQAIEYSKKHPNNDRNNPEYGNLVDGDIIMSSGEVSLDPLNAITDKDKLWTDNTIYYTISNEFTTEQLELIQAGIDDLVESTKINGEICVNILPRENQQNYVYVYKGGGCSSYLGMIGGRQTLSLADGCVSRHGTIMHEFLHAFGFHHEHKRADRDDWVTINFDNIEPGKEHNFEKLEEGVTVDHLGTGYDYGSVLHYSAYAFAVDPTIPTIIPKDPEAEIGQRVQLAQLDIERVQIFYGCLSPEKSIHFKHLAIGK